MVIAGSNFVGLLHCPLRAYCSIPCAQWSHLQLCSCIRLMVLNKRSPDFEMCTRNDIEWPSWALTSDPNMTDHPNLR